MTPFIVKPDARTIPTQDEFDAWSEHPVTRFVAAAWQAAALAQRDAWTEKFGAFVNAVTVESLMRDEIDRRTLAARADAYSAFLETGLNRYVELNTQDR